MDGHDERAIRQLGKSIDRLAEAINAQSYINRIEYQITELKELIMSALTDIQAALDQVNINTDEMAVEVARIRTELETLANDIVNGVSAADAQAIKDRIAVMVESTQTLETQLRETGKPLPPA